MADSGTLHDAFVDELRDTYDAEKQLTKALPKMAKAASAPSLRSAFEAHLKETQGHVERLEEVFAHAGRESHAANTATASPASSKKASRSWKRTSTKPRWMRA